MENHHVNPAPEGEVEDPVGTSAALKKGIPITEVEKYLRFIIFLTVIGLVYIWNSHRAEGRVRRVQELENEVRELKSDYSNLSAELSYSTRRSVLEKRVDSIGLMKMDKPPFMLN